MQQCITFIFFSTTDNSITKPNLVWHQPDQDTLESGNQKKVNPKVN